MRISQRIIEEIARQGMIRVSDPDPDSKHTFVWRTNACDQLDATVSAEIATCDHPDDDRIGVPGATQWCRKCGAIRSNPGALWVFPRLF
jgi:hypothetical protein